MLRCSIPHKNITLIEKWSFYWIIVTRCEGIEARVVFRNHMFSERWTPAYQTSSVRVVRKRRNARLTGAALWKNFFLPMPSLNVPSYHPYNLSRRSFSLKGSPGNIFTTAATCTTVPATIQDLATREKGLIDSDREKGGEKQREKDGEKGKDGTWSSSVTRDPFTRSLSEIVEMDFSIS